MIALLGNLKEGKSSGMDEILLDVLKLGGEELRELKLQIHDAGEFPEDFEKHITISILNEVGAEDFRTLYLTTHASKILCRIIKNKIEKISEKVLGEDKFRFPKDKRTRKPILIIKDDHM